MTKSIKLAQLAELLKGTLAGDGEIVITGIRSLEEARADEISFLSDEKHAAKAAGSGAGALIVKAHVASIAKPQIAVSNVDAGLVAAMKFFAPVLAAVKAGVHATAVVDSSAKIDASASVGAYTVIGPNVQIGAEVVIGALCHVGENSSIGPQSRLDANVTVYHNCRIGTGVIIQAGSVIGSTGFGYSWFEGKHNLIPHNGGVVIEDNVEIGACCCVDRAKFGDTVVGAGSKLDNFVQVAHNVIMGKSCLIVAQVGLAGSSVLGNGVVLGGQVGVADHVKIGDGTMVGAKAGVVMDLGEGLKVAGTPPIDVREAIRIAMATQKLPEMVKQLKDLNQRLAKLEAAKDNRE